MREIEIKFKVNNSDAILSKLKEQGCVLSEPITQHDVVYAKAGETQAWENSQTGDIILRLRHQNDKTLFTLKQQKSSEGDNIEHELEISDQGTMHSILLVLGYVPHVEVKKVRRKGKVGDYEVCYDEVDRLGTYIEFEQLVDDNANPEEVRKKLFKFAALLGLQQENEELKGYDTQIYFLNHHA